MKRRNFIKDITLSSALVSVLPQLNAANQIHRLNNDRILNAYYLRAHMYTIVPKHIREDLKWMADAGTNTVSLGIIEQDLYAAVENINIICNEAAKLNMKVFAVPSRWGGLLAGAPKIPSLFSVTNPQTWMLKKDGTTLFNDISGVISSIHYPETVDFFKTSLDKIFKLWDIKGIIWDEPKSFFADYSAKAIEKLGKDAAWPAHIRAVVDFYAGLNKYLKDAHPNVSTTLFTYADSTEAIIKEAALCTNLDYYGCDGRPWKNEDGGKQESAGKVLLGNGERFLKVAKENNKKTMWLIENHNLAHADIDLMDRRLPDVMKCKVDHLAYYYYPRNIQDPEKCMKVIRRHLKDF
jgi:hypothetical protein